MNHFPLPIRTSLIVAAACGAMTICASCGSVPSSSSSTHGMPSPSLNSLAMHSLQQGSPRVVTNYRATYAVTSSNTDVMFTYVVHSPTNWEEFAGGAKPIVIVVNGTTYNDVPSISGGTVSYAWQKAQPVPYKTTPYPSTVASIAELSAETGVKVIAAGSCREGNASGTAWKTVPASPGAVSPSIAYCTDAHSGVLLWYAFGIGKLAQFGILPQNASTTLQISDIGTVPSIALPN